MGFGVVEDLIKNIHIITPHIISDYALCVEKGNEIAQTLSPIATNATVETIRFQVYPMIIQNVSNEPLKLLLSHAYIRGYIYAENTHYINSYNAYYNYYLNTWKSNDLSTFEYGDEILLACYSKNIPKATRYGWIDMNLVSKVLNLQITLNPDEYFGIVIKGSSYSDSAYIWNSTGFKNNNFGLVVLVLPTKIT
jgi:hypothetical protein